MTTRRILWVALGALVLLVMSSVVGAQRFSRSYLDGNELWTLLGLQPKTISQGPGAMGEMLSTTGAQSYILGVVDAGTGVHFCPLAGAVSTNQITDIVRNWLRDHPERRHQSAALLIEIALAEKFSCNKKASR